MDFLGLRNLDVLEITLDLVERSTGSRPDIDHVPLDDPKTFELLQRGRHDRRVPARRRADARAAALARPTRSRTSPPLVALYRPGPMAQNWHNEYADRKNGRKPVAFTTPTSRRSSRPPTG
jgi:DNA polymerase-3 subunit alpha